MPATATHPAAVAGHIEIRKLNGGRWHLICPPGAGAQHTLADGLPRKRNAVAVRALLLAEIPDWEPIIAAGGVPDTEPGRRAANVVRMVRRVVARSYRSVCLGCGYRICTCGTDQHADGPHYTEAELGWFR